MNLAYVQIRCCSLPVFAVGCQCPAHTICYFFLYSKMPGHQKAKILRLFYVRVCLIHTSNMNLCSNVCLPYGQLAVFFYKGHKPSRLNSLYCLDMLNNYTSCMSISFFQFLPRVYSYRIMNTAVSFSYQALHESRNHLV